MHQEHIINLNVKASDNTKHVKERWVKIKREMNQSIIIPWAFKALSQQWIKLTKNQ